MPSFSPRSLERLSTCHPDIQRVLGAAIEFIDFVVLEGHRGQEAQDTAYHDGKSQLQWPESRHNRVPSEAVDIAPWPLDWNDREAFFYLAGVIQATARHLGVRLRWGGRWKMQDLPHFEIAREE